MKLIEPSLFMSMSSISAHRSVAVRVMPWCCRKSAASMCVILCSPAVFAVSWNALHRFGTSFHEGPSTKMKDVPAGGGGGRVHVSTSASGDCYEARLGQPGPLDSNLGPYGLVHYQVHYTTRPLLHPATHEPPPAGGWAVVQGRPRL